MEKILNNTKVLKILILDDKASEIDRLKSTLNDIKVIYGIELEPICFTNPSEALSYLTIEEVDAIITDKDLQNPIDGITFIKQYFIKKKNSIPTILYSAGVLNNKEDTFCKENEILPTHKSSTHNQRFLYDFLQKIPNLSNSTSNISLKRADDRTGIIDDLKQDLINKLKKDGNLNQFLYIGPTSGSKQRKITISELIYDIENDGDLGISFLRSYNNIKRNHSSLFEEEQQKKTTFLQYVKKIFKIFF